MDETPIEYAYLAWKCACGQECVGTYIKGQVPTFYCKACGSIYTVHDP